MSDKLIVEDGRSQSPLEARIRDALAFYGVQHEYDGSSWDGIEKFHLNLTAAVRVAAIQSAGWYQYPGSVKQWDGKDWRLVVPDQDGRDVVINCHSLLHDGLWSLSVTIYDTAEIDRNVLQFIGEEDPWQRSMRWSVMVLDKLVVEGLDYREARVDMLSRMRLALFARPMMLGVKTLIDETYEDVFGEADELPDTVTLAVADWNLLEGKIGSFKYEGAYPFGILTLNPEVFERGAQMVWTVMAHELAHAAIGEESDNHGEKFQELATALGIPEKYQD